MCRHLRFLVIKISIIIQENPHIRKDKCIDDFNSFFFLSFICSSSGEFPVPTVSIHHWSMPSITVLHLRIRRISALISPLILPLCACFCPVFLSVPYKRIIVPLLIKMGLPGWLSDKESACQCRIERSNPWSERSSGEGNGNPLQYSYLENSMDGGVSQAIQSIESQRIRHD